MFLSEDVRMSSTMTCCENGRRRDAESHQGSDPVLWSHHHRVGHWAPLVFGCAVRIWDDWISNCVSYSSWLITYNLFVDFVGHINYIDKWENHGKSHFCSLLFDGGVDLFLILIPTIRWRPPQVPYLCGWDPNTRGWLSSAWFCQGAKGAQDFLHVFLHGSVGRDSKRRNRWTDRFSITMSQGRWEELFSGGNFEWPRTERKQSL